MPSPKKIEKQLVNITMEEAGPSSPPQLRVISPEGYISYGEDDETLPPTSPRRKKTKGKIRRLVDDLRKKFLGKNMHLAHISEQYLKPSLVCKAAHGGTVASKMFVKDEDLKGPFRDACVLCQFGILYVIGGYCNGIVSEKVYQMDVTASVLQWSRATSLNTARANHAAAATPGLWISGGKDGEGKAIATLEYWSMYTMEDYKLWISYDKTLLTPRYEHCMIGYQDYLYVFGGRNGDGDYLTSIEQMDITGYGWKGVSNMIHPRAQFSVCRKDNIIYIIGGQKSQGSSVTTIEMLDVRTGQISALDLWPEDMTFSGGDYAGFNLKDGFLYMAAWGMKRRLLPDESGKIDCIRKFNPEEKKWDEDFNIKIEGDLQRWCLVAVAL